MVVLEGAFDGSPPRLVEEHLDDAELDVSDDFEERGARMNVSDVGLAGSEQ